MNYEEKIETLENQISFLLQEYNILANKMNEYTAAFKIIENSMPDLKERANKLEKYWNNTRHLINNINFLGLKLMEDMTQEEISEFHYYYFKQIIP